MSVNTTYKPTGVAILDQPVTGLERASYVRRMFDDIAPRYDLLNSLLSANVHHGWRTFATRCAALEPGDAVLDVCTGTGDWAVLLKQKVGADGLVAGVDFSLPMLRHGQNKLGRARVPSIQGDATRLPYASNVFQAATVAFGIRNIPEIDRAFSEMTRVVKPGGRVVCLEFAEPHTGVFRKAYELYSRTIMPSVGGVISGRRDAYAYLPASVRKFKNRDEICAIMRAAGLVDVRYVDLTFGMVCVHVGVKPLASESS